MTPRENLLAAFAHRDVAWVPWLPHVGGVNTPSFVPQELKDKKDDIATGLFLQETLGCDLLITAYLVSPTYQTAKVRWTENEHMTVHEVTIAGRTLRCEHTRSAWGDQITSAISRYPVQTPEDMETLGWLFQDSWMAVDQPALDDMIRRLGNQGVVDLDCPRSPLMQLISNYMGLERMVELMSDYPEAFERLLGIMHETSLGTYRTLVKTNCEVITSAEDFSTQLINPSMFRNQVMPYLKEYTAICRAAGKVYRVHSCGHIRAFLPLCLEIGYDAHDDLTQPLLGNTTVAEARAAWGETITLMAAVDPVGLESNPPEVIAARVRQMLQEAGTTRALILQTTSKPSVREENLRAVGAVLHG